MARKLFGTGVEVTGDGAELAGGLVAELHQVLGDHGQFGPAILDALGKNAEQRLQGPRFCPHFDDRPGEPFRLFPARPPEHDPGQAEQGQRPGREGQPLCNRRRGQGLTGKRPARRPCAIAKPESCKDDETAAEDLSAARAAELRFSARFVPRKLVETGRNVLFRGRLCHLGNLRRRKVGALSAWLHERQFTIFVIARKTLQSAGGRLFG